MAQTGGVTRLRARSNVVGLQGTKVVRGAAALAVRPGRQPRIPAAADGICPLPARIALGRIVRKMASVERGECRVIERDRRCTARAVRGLAREPSSGRSPPREGQARAGH